MNGKRWKQDVNKHHHVVKSFIILTLVFGTLSNITLTNDNDNHIHMMSSCHNNLQIFWNKRIKK
jgi:hypothetical protein